MRSLLLVLVTAAACGGATSGELEAPVRPGTASPSPATIADDIAGLNPGESLRFEVKLAGVLVGEASLAVGDVGMVDGHRAIGVSSRITAAGALALIREVRDEATSVVDLDHLTPISNTADVVFGPKSYHAETTFSDHRARIEYHPDDGATTQLHYDFGDHEIHDAHTAMARVRVWTAEPGQSLELWMVGGRRIWESEIHAIGHEVIGTRLGNQPALRLDGISRRALSNLTIDTSRPPRTFTVWLSDDADRVPLLLQAHTELGDVTMELVEYSRP